MQHSGSGRHFCVTRDRLLDLWTLSPVGVIGTTGTAVAWQWQWLPQYQHWHLPWNTVHGLPSVVQHQVQNSAKPQGGLWVVGGLWLVTGVLCVTFFDIRWGLFNILLFPMLHTGSGLPS